MKNYKTCTYLGGIAMIIELKTMTRYALDENKHPIMEDKAREVKSNVVCPLLHGKCIGKRCALFEEFPHAAEQPKNRTYGKCALSTLATIAINSNSIVKQHEKQ